MIEIIYYNGQETKDISFEELKNIFPIKSGVLWIDLIAPAPAEIKKLLVDLFKFHPLTIEDCSIFIDHPTLDDYGNYLFGVFHSLNYHEKELRVATWEIDFFIGKNYLITNHLKPLSFLPELKSKFRTKFEQFLKGPDFIVQHLLDTMVATYYPILINLKKKLNETETEIFRLVEQESDTINDIYKIKRNLSVLKRVLHPQMQVLSDIIKFKDKYFSEESITYFNDIVNHLERIRNMVNEYLEMGNDTLDAHLSLSSHKMNKIMKRLTVIMTIFMPLTVLSGVGGMSEWSMITKVTPENWYISYSIFMVGLILFGFATYYILKWKKWV